MSVNMVYLAGEQEVLIFWRVANYRRTIIWVRLLLECISELGWEGREAFYINQMR